VLGVPVCQGCWIAIIAMSDLPVLITGGAGFIGSHLVDALLAKGNSVRVLDNLSSGKLDNLPRGNARLDLVEGDIADTLLLREVMNGCGAVVHLAAVASVQASVSDPLGCHRSNFIGTLNVCEAMRELGIRRLLFASSAAVYGNNGEGEAIGEDTPKSPLTPYGMDKLASEHYLDFYRRQHGLEPAIFRFFNIYGPRQDPSSPYSGVISIFAERAAKRSPITVFGDGEQTRDFVYVADLIGLLLQALEMRQVPVGAVNVGLSRGVSLNRLLDELAALFGGLPEVRREAVRPGDIRHSRADNRRLLACYRLSGLTPMAAGLARLLEGVRY